MLVLVKLFTPPVVTIGVPLPFIGTVAESREHEADNEETHPPETVSSGVEQIAMAESPQPIDLPEITTSPRPVDAAIDATVPVVEARSPSWPMILVWLWGLGTVVVASRHAFRILWFRRVLGDAQAPPSGLCRIAECVARRIGLRRVPEILVLPIRLSPLVWCMGGRPRVILPSELLERLGPDAQEAILAHELAHVRRKDHVVRLLELLATMVFWWHPVVWWARRELRDLEEQCCDAMVLDRAPHGTRAYAIALADTLDFLSEAPVVVSAAATGAKPAVSLARRIAMLKNPRPISRLAIGHFFLLAVVAAVPMIVAFAAEPPQEKEDARVDVEESSKHASSRPNAQGRKQDRSLVAKEDLSSESFPSQELTVGAVEEVTTDKPGARVIRFSVDVPKGRRFCVRFRQVPSGACASSGLTFENERDEPALIQVTFRYRNDRDPGEPLGDVLLSKEKLIGYRMKAEGCHPSGELVTFVGVPLRDLDPSDKELLLLGPNDVPSQSRFGVRVLLIAAKDAKPRTSEEVDALKPRGELIVSLVPAEDGAPKRDPMRQLSIAWHRQASEVGTAYVKYRRVRAGPSTFKPLDRKAVYGLVSSFPLETQPEQVFQLVRKLAREEALKGWDPEAPPGTHVFRSVGLKTYEVSSRDGRMSDARLYDGEIDVSFSANNRQADVYRAGDSRVARTKLADFRILAPRQAIPGEKVATLEDGCLLLSQGGSEIAADASTGFVRRYLTKDSDGNAYRESFQYGPLSYGGNILFPRLKLDIGYNKGRLYSVSVVVVDEAHFNEGFSNADFKLKLPEGTNIVDRRRDKFRPDFHRVRDDVNDAAEYLKEHAPGM